MPQNALTADAIVPHLRSCGYTESRLARNYTVRSTVLPVAGFYGKPWDVRSACLAVVETVKDGKSAAKQCLELGAPTAFVCRGDMLEWWRLSADGPSESRLIKAAEVSGFFREHKRDLAPESIYAAKMRRPTRNAQQMWFVDVGLMAATERRAGETLHRWVEGVIQQLASRLGAQLRSKKNFADLYKTVFWLFAAKLLHEKGVDNFKRISLTDVDDVFRRVGRHYTDIDDLPPGGRAWRPAIDDAAETIANWGHLGNISAESLAYLYETALIDAKPKGKAGKGAKGGRDIRKELGIHSTPPMLIDHMLAQLWPLIEQQEPSDRKVFEPACGHAGFLVAAMRWLRDFSGIDDGVVRHRYLRDRLHGIEVDPFARELAKLQLTLADVPHGNSWRIEDADMFMPGVLRKAAASCTLLLANPPYEPFTARERKIYNATGEQITAITKAVEVLKRTLPNLSGGGVFGVVMPQGFLHSKEAKRVRELILQHCELLEISVFADNLFEHGDHETAILLGRCQDRKRGTHTLMYRRVREQGMVAFKERLAFSSEERINVTRFEASPTADFRVPELDGVWSFLCDYAQLRSIATVGQGLTYKNKDLPRNAWTIHAPARKGDPKGFANVPENLAIYGLPVEVGMNLDRAVLLRIRTGLPSGKPQILLNYAPVSRQPWKLKAVIDERGRAITSRFVNVRPKEGCVGPVYLWALLNSPVANAFVYCHTLKRHVSVGTIRSLPIPRWSPGHVSRIEQAAMRYRTLATSAGPLYDTSATPEGIRQALLEMDAAVMNAYDLPPRMERQLLDLFQGVERKGLGCKFTGYYPEGFSSYLPLHLLISDRFQRAAADQTADRFKAGESDYVRTVLEVASTGFGEE